MKGKDEFKKTGIENRTFYYFDSSDILLDKKTKNKKKTKIL